MAVCLDDDGALAGGELARDAVDVGDQVGAVLRVSGQRLTGGEAVADDDIEPDGRAGCATAVAVVELEAKPERIGRFLPCAAEDAGRDIGLRCEGGDVGRARRYQEGGARGEGDDGGPWLRVSAGGNGSRQNRGGCVPTVCESITRELRRCRLLSAGS